MCRLTMAKMLEEIVNYSSGEETEYMADLIAADHVLFGKFHTTEEELDEFFGDFMKMSGGIDLWQIVP
jgi:predicted house-cleaning noncanonical NTP pyrophosphatase (MazG superfamily)